MVTIHLSYPKNPTHWTRWHPTTCTGPFATLVRGQFETEADAHEWARVNGVHPDTYTVEPVIDIL